jgi:ribosomal-protein-alanine N-acetyltransferase
MNGSPADEPLMDMPRLETERLLIRPFADADLPAVRAILEVDSTDAGSERYVRHGGLNAVVLSELGQPPLGDRAIVLRSTDELIGLVGLVPAFGPFDQLRPMGEASPSKDRPPAHHRIEIGLYYNLRADHRGRGYATEAARALVDFAFERMDLGRIVATTERDNLASQAVMRQLGMRLNENARPEPEWFQVVGVLENPNALLP